MISIILIIPIILLVYLYYKKTVPAIIGKRRWLLISLRSLVIFILLMLLLNPIISFIRSKTEYPLIVFLADNSNSMKLPANDDNSKREQFEQYLEQINREAQGNNYRTQVFNFADGIDGSKTSANISKTLENLSSRVNFSNIDRIFLLSDGWFADRQLDIVNRLNVPVTTIHPQYEPSDYELGIERIVYNQTAYTEDETPILADLYSSNYDGNAELSLYIDDDLIETKKIDFSEASIQQAAFNHIFTRAGLVPVRLEIHPLKTDDINATEHLTDNIHTGAIRVLEKRSSIIIITDKLGWDVRFLSNAFKIDDRRDVSVIISQGNRFMLGREQVNLQDLFEPYLQLIVLINSGSLTFQNQEVGYISRFVGNGGGLLTIGKPISVLESITAITDSGIDRAFRSTISFTSESRKYRTFNEVDAAKIPPLDYYYINTLLEAKVLARFNNDEHSPAITHNVYRDGRVISFPFFNLWRLQLRVAGNIYNEFINNLSAWLANPSESDFFAQTDKNSYLLGETVTVELTAFDETLSINPNLNPLFKLSLDSEDGEQEILAEYLLFEGRYYSIEIPQLDSGNYSYKISEETTGKTAEGDFIVSSMDADSRNRGYNHPLLSFISRQTGGQVLFDENLDSFTLDAAQSKTERYRTEIPIYRHWLIITLFLISFCLELYLRKRWGLL